MIIYSNENNTSTLKLLIAANISSKQVEIKYATFTDQIFNGPKYLPILEVNESLRFFSSNAAASYLFPSKDAVAEQCQQYLEWEAVRLSPVLQSLSKANSDVKQMATSLIKDLDKILGKDKYLCGSEVSVSDVSIWCALYNISNNKDLNDQYLGSASNVQRWYREIATLKYVQDAITKWAPNSNSLGATSAYGVPQVSTLSPGTPEEPAVAGPTADEIEKAKVGWLNGSKGLKPATKQEKVILPVKGRKNVLITSALPYVNNVPHLGNIIGCVLSADIFARYCRLCDYNALFICGTDEYGTATETKALEEGLTPRQICDKYYTIHNDVYRWFNIGFDHFGRTSTEEQTKITQAMFTKLRENGFILTQSVDQLLCTKCDRFLADRFVEGQCHHPGCLYENARGDQCDKCGKLINAVELINPKCKVCGEKPVLKASEQLFLELGQLEPSVRTWVSQNEAGWSPSARAVSRAWLKEGLRARAITRDLKWGVPVPHPGFQNKVFYVWFDAPMGYMSITECATKQYEKWWRPDKEMNVELYQFMAKDNVPFHAVMFPATLLGVNEGHVLVKHLYATEYLNYEEGKFSKSRGVGVFGTDAQDTGIPADVWRFYLASIRPESSDSSFSWVELGTRNNSELLNNLGNFCHRSLSFCANSFKGHVPKVTPTADDYELIALINREIIAYVTQMSRGRLREALKHVLLISKLGNQHMQSEQPWVLLKGDENEKIRGSTAIGLCCQIAATLCALISPYMPETSRRLATQLNLPIERLRINPENPSLLQLLPEEHVIGKPEPLFTKIEPSHLEELKLKYAGTQSERQNGGQGESISDLESVIAKQGEKVRQLKSSTKDTSVWQPEVNILLDLKKKLTELQKNPPKAQAKPAVLSATSVQDLEAAIAAQGDKVRQLKASTKDKSVWQPEVNKLLELKKNLVELQKTQATPAASTTSVADLEAAIAKQGDKVRQLKSSTKDKTVWQPEVNVLLDLKKQLANLQIK